MGVFIFAWMNIQDKLGRIPKFTVSHFQFFYIKESRLFWFVRDDL